MKSIGTVLNLIELAEKRAAKSGSGEATRNKRERYYNWGGGVTVGDMQEVYRVECELRGRGVGFDLYKLYHYGTLTANVVVNNDGTPVARYVYGESRSDADSVNTFLDYFGIDTQYTYRPVNGGFMEVE